MTREELLAIEPFERYLIFKDNPFLWMIHCVRTKDQVDRDNPIKPFPNKEYLKLVAKLWMKYPLTAFPKSRRMTLSWTMISLYLHDVIFNNGRFTAFVSKKEEDSHELVMRAMFIVDNLDREMMPEDFIPKYKDKFCRLEFYDIDSKIWGFAQGADQLRQFTFSGILGDECAFWEQAKEFYSASFPTIDGGGRMTLISSPAPGFFKKLCFDQLDQLGDFSTAENVPDYQVPMQGVRVWTNKKNRFLVAELHYTADAIKRSDEYRDSLKNSMPTMEFLREYELNWETFSGYPVYPEFNKKWHVMKEKPTAQYGLPLLIGVDFGLTPAALIGQMQEDKLILMSELIEVNMGIERFADKLIQKLRFEFKDWSNLKEDIMMFIDPSGHFRRDTDETTAAQILAKKGFRTFPGPVTWEERREAVTYFLKKMTKDGPGFQIYERDCPTLIKGFDGGYRYNDRVGDIEPSKLRPIKDHFSHIHDCCQYLAHGIRGKTRSIISEIPRPLYNRKDETRGSSTWQSLRTRSRY